MFAFALAIFTGAFLLFQVQPLIAKYILPWFGGAPAVWTTCMLFFQVLLLGGYAYAHLTSRWLKPRAQAILHFVLLAGALALLPIIPSNSWKPTGIENPTLRILALLLSSLGLPYFVLSSTGPLMQQWFSRTNPGRSPYRLYALSNVGSLLALVSYPVLFETHFTRKVQASLWGWGLAAFAVFCGFCAIKVFKNQVSRGQGETKAEIREPEYAMAAASLGRSKEVGATDCTDSTDRHEKNPPSVSSVSSVAPPKHEDPSISDHLLWLLLPACASVLLLAITNKMCQDLAVIPFLWVVPLSLYLLSFVICFDSPRWYVRLPFAVALVAAFCGVYWALPKGVEAPLFLLLSIYSGALFICCMVCHGELYRLRPDPRQLTSYYLMIAAGGALGGILVAVVAPLIFRDYYELQWGLLLCGVLLLVTSFRGANFGRLSHWAGLVFPALGFGLALLGVAFWLQAHKFDFQIVEKARNFYGVLTVFEADKENPDYHHFALVHGQIRHGLQFVNPMGASFPTLYYSPNSGVGLAIPALPHGPRRMGLVGLGIGTLAAYARTNDYLRFYEINPEVLRLANAHFSYLMHCKGNVDIVMGDARLSMEREPSQQFDLLALDAFTGDAIPVHLLTAEAFELYNRHLKPNGVIAVHISNGYLNLDLVLAKIAKKFSYHAAVVVAEPPSPDKWWMMASTWVLLTHNPDFLNTPSIQAVAKPPRLSDKVPLWTDDFTSLYQILD